MPSRTLTHSSVSASMPYATSAPPPTHFRMEEMSVVVERARAKGNSVCAELMVLNGAVPITRKKRRASLAAWDPSLLLTLHEDAPDAAAASAAPAARRSLTLPSSDHAVHKIEDVIDI